MVKECGLNHQTLGFDLKVEQIKRSGFYHQILGFNH